MVSGISIWAAVICEQPLCCLLLWWIKIHPTFVGLSVYMLIL